VAYFGDKSEVMRRYLKDNKEEKQAIFFQRLQNGNGTNTYE
jgi:hypothetical protein